MSDFDPQNRANLAWSYALLVVCDTPLIDAIAEASIAKISEYSWQSLANTAWAFANLEIMDRTLLDAIAASARALLHYLSLDGWARRDLVALALGLLGIAWAHAFLSVDCEELGVSLQGGLARISREVGRRDDLRPALARQGPDFGPAAPASTALGEPRIDVDLRGMVVIHKPPDWEVDGKGRYEGEQSADELPLALSAWLQSELPRSRCPVTHDVSLDYGFLHRLDVPSSGLILCGTTFAGLLALRWQLDTYRVERQYAVWGHDLASSNLREVVANIDPQSIDSQRSFVSEMKGKPAKSWFVVPAHFSAITGRGAARLEGSDPCSAFIVRIRTGRRHQIRAHMLHAGHPTVVDGKYTACQVVFYHLANYEQGYLRAGRTNGGSALLTQDK